MTELLCEGVMLSIQVILSVGPQEENRHEHGGCTQVPCLAASGRLGPLLPTIGQASTGLGTSGQGSLTAILPWPLTCLSHLPQAWLSQYDVFPEARSPRL